MKIFFKETKKDTLSEHITAIFDFLICFFAVSCAVVFCIDMPTEEIEVLNFNESNVVEIKEISDKEVVEHDKKADRKEKFVLEYIEKGGEVKVFYEIFEEICNLE